MTRSWLHILWMATLITSSLILLAAAERDRDGGRLELAREIRLVREFLQQK